MIETALKSVRYALAGSLLSAGAAFAHFQEILPATDIYDGSAGPLAIDLAFTHPMERGPAMEMKRPVRFGVLGPQGDADLLSTLTEKAGAPALAWTTGFTPTEPGDYIFYVEPQPYWEPSEDKSIIHYSKVIVDSFGWGADWEKLVGLPVEIEPLARPYGLWTGNIFSGIVRRDGAPVPYAEIEVEWVNDGSITAPADAYITQVIRADGNGVFQYALPHSGWWGFAALVEADYQLPDPSGAMKPVELGGLIWVNARDMK